ncbi:MAG: glycosyltransferase [Actinobacteria bacterium]|nr:glycosyltransferase [Actinomycetota bacterium]
MGVKVLHLIDSGGLYGAEKMLLSLVQQQLKQGLEPMILSAGTPDIEEKAIEKEARRLELPLTVWRMKPGLNVRETKKIIDWAVVSGFSLFHSHGYKFNILLGLAPRGWKKLPIFTTLHGYVHARRFSKMWLYECLDRFALRKMHGIALVSNAMIEEIPDVLKNSARVRVITNGLSIDDLEKRSVEPLEANIENFFKNHEPVLLGVGRLSKEKGFDRLLPAFKEIKSIFPSAGLLIVGEGNMRNFLEIQRNGLDLENSLLMPGYYPNVPSLLNSANLLVVPSFTEGLPILILEAMAIKTPIIATAVGGIPEVLGEGLGGTVIDNPTKEVLTKELVLALKNPEYTKHKAEWSYSAVRQSYSSEAMASKYKIFYEGGLL